MTERQALRIAETLRKPSYGGVKTMRFIYEPERIHEGLSYGRYDDPDGIGVFYMRPDGYPELRMDVRMKIAVIVLGSVCLALMAYGVSCDLNRLWDKWMFRRDQKRLIRQWQEHMDLEGLWHLDAVEPDRTLR